MSQRQHVLVARAYTTARSLEAEGIADKNVVSLIQALACELDRVVSDRRVELRAHEQEVLHLKKQVRVLEKAQRLDAEAAQ